MEKQKIWELLGYDAKSTPITGELLTSCEQENYIQESLLLELNQEEPVPAYFVYPKNCSSFPVFIFHHSHGGDFKTGKEELFAGASYLQQPAFADSFTALGCGVIAIDAWGFGERQGMPESQLVKKMLLEGRTLWGMRLFDSIALLDYLEQRPEVQTDKIGTIGMSLGAMQSWWLAALDERISCCIDICGQVDLETLMDYCDLDAHGFYYYVPRLLHYFSTSDIQKWIAPRWRFSANGRHDHLTPLKGIEKLNHSLTTVYQKAGYPERFQTYLSSGSHQETLAMREKWQQFVKTWLQSV